MFSANDLILIRHAAADSGGRLSGRTDVGLAGGFEAEAARLAEVLPGIAGLHVSPALRCRLTASALWPDARQEEDARLWEQDFGDWEGMPFSDLPDLGQLSRDALAAHAPPSGESFLDLQARACPALETTASLVRTGEGAQVVVAHAGIVRAAISMALGEASAGLAFEIAPLSVTCIACLPEGFAIRRVNWRPV